MPPFPSLAPPPLRCLSKHETIAMSFSTIITCDGVQFSVSDRYIPLDDTPTAGHDNWHPAKISLQQMGPRNCWIMVEVDGLPLPVVHRALGEGWHFSSDNYSNSLVVRGQDADTRAIVVLKLQFSNAQDFWSFMFQLMLTRVQEYEYLREQQARQYVGQDTTGC